jgi:hypothetical protein
MIENPPAFAAGSVTYTDSRNVATIDAIESINLTNPL